MATKTISVDIEAYERLRRARLHASESFSKVIKRAQWDRGLRTGAEFLAAMDGLPLMSENSLDGLEQAQVEDSPPENSWLPSSDS